MGTSGVSDYYDLGNWNKLWKGRTFYCPLLLNHWVQFWCAYLWCNNLPLHRKCSEYTKQISTKGKTTERGTFFFFKVEAMDMDLK